MPRWTWAGIIHTGEDQLSVYQLSPKIKHYVWVVLILVASCNAPITQSVPQTGDTPIPPKNTLPGTSPTPFIPKQATPTPGIVNIWLAPSVPDDLRSPIQELTQIANRPITIISDESMADVRVEAWADVQLAEWIYAVVAPFPMIIDSITMEQLRAAWRGENPEIHQVFVQEEDAPAIEALLGESSPDVVRFLEAEGTIEQIWLDKSTIAIVPFGSLEPRWKVLEIEGQSPLRNDFDPQSYPLGVTFGLSGDPMVIPALEQSLDWPSTNRDPERLTVFLMTGVTALTRATAWQMEINGIKFPAEEILPWLLEADITHISNEVSFLDTCPPPNPVREGLSFCSDPAYAELLQFIDVDVIELTGNHIKDHGVEGLSQTLEIYRQNEWGIFGGGANLEAAYQPLLIEHNGNRLAFLGCNFAGPPAVWAKEDSPGGTPCDYEILFAELQRLKSEGYLPIFTFQWKEFNRATPLTGQVEAFRAAIDAGAVIVSGSQAHQPQGMEFYGDGFIHYGLGNLFFDQMWALQVRQEFLDRYVFYDGRHISTELLTAMLEHYAQPRTMTPEERATFLEEIFIASGW